MPTAAPTPPGKGFSSAPTGLTLARAMLALTIAGLSIGAAFTGRELVALYHVRSQVSQIADLDAAVADFQEKYEGLPGDLLWARAKRQGLPAGDGTPAHSDGDGKISPCNLGWQWYLGCETALFWSHLSISGMISENFSADSRFINNRLGYVGSMSPYLPQAKIGKNLYITVWNSDVIQPSPSPQLPYGNYYEISEVTGVKQDEMQDDFRALTPGQARAIDAKMDDGLPFSGRVVVNGEADWPQSTWGTYAKTGASKCVSPDNAYNSRPALRSHALLCHLAIALH